MSALLLSTLSLILLPSSATGLHFDVQPTKIEIGLSMRFYLNCSFNHGTDPEMSSLVALFISRAQDTTNVDFHEIASVNTFSGNVSNMIHDNATISGVINNLGVSFLSMEWKFPGDQVSGLYKCVANGVDGTGHPISVMSTSQVTSEMPGTKELVQLVRDLMIKIDYAPEDNTCISGCWQRRLEQMMKARFEITSLYNGHRYLLSKISNHASVAVAQESCELYGGYLAEIDDADELLFVQNFIKSNRNVDFILVLIGGTDEGHEKHWVFERTGRNVTFTKWDPGYPSVDTRSNCLYLRADLYLWIMGDNVCFRTDSNYNSRYMCELPEQ
ncbi:unnamed protein product [Lymnaea stagnalis]|uniref:C-type lectin domain-containing protein n=1 Tax=Lymnaea stagnalis TaxID=6523 RepID=A0AAV2IJN7_LYMST